MKILLWTTQTHALPVEEAEKTISAVYTAVKSLKNVQLVIKLHPSENQEAPLYKANQSIRPTILSAKEDINELLYICELLITKASTTALEAALMNKPVIILNLSGEADIANYVEEGIAVGVYHATELAKSIREVLYDKQVRSQLARAREKFIKAYAYKQDGKATERVIQIIESYFTHAKHSSST